MTRSRARTSKESPPARDRMRLRSRPLRRKMIESEWSESDDELDFRKENKHSAREDMTQSEDFPHLHQPITLLFPSSQPIFRTCANLLSKQHRISTLTSPPRSRSSKSSSASSSLPQAALLKPQPPPPIWPMMLRTMDPGKTTRTRCLISAQA